MPKKTATKEKNKKQQSYGKMIGDREVNDYKEHLFDVDKFGGQEEAEALIKRYEKKVTLTEEQKNNLAKNIPPKPDFQVLTQAQYNSKFCNGRRKYRNKVKGYFEERRKYYTIKEKNGKSTKGTRFAELRGQLEAKIETLESDEVTALVKESDDALEKYRQQGFFPDINENPDSMDAAYEEMIDDEELVDGEELEENKKRIEAEADIAAKEAAIHQKIYGGYMQALKAYSYTNYANYNKFYRNDQEGAVPGDVKRSAETMHMRPLSRDLITRRGVTNGFNCMMGMLGYPDINSVDELKEYIQKKIDNKEELVATEKGFMSTSQPFATKMIGAEKGMDIGIEFIILMKKGTAAADIGDFSVFNRKKGNGDEYEAEVLAAPGTKFKIVGAKMGDDNGVYHGEKGSWKIYLVSVPDNKKGTLK